MTHAQQQEDRRDHILDNILQAVGSTPMVRLNVIPQEHGIQCEMLAKCEFLNPGGSLKDRIGVRMLLDAEASGRVKPGDMLIEATSGNTGVGLAMAAAVTKHPLIITMPVKMSHEKQVVLEAFGATVVRTPNVAFDHPESLIEKAKALRAEDPEHRHILDQYKNPSNYLAHEEGTGEEIWNQCGGKVDMVVIGTGTGGTITGVARRLKEKNPNIIIVGADPEGSLLADPAHPPAPKMYQVEGVGYDFVPDVCHRQLVDEWVKTEDKSSFDLARQLQRKEGMLVGGSSGGILAAALTAAKRLGPGQRCVVVLPDNIRNYLGKFADDNWMMEHGFADSVKVVRPTYDKLKAEKEALERRVADLEAKLAAK